MKEIEIKGSNPELIVDHNGYAIQAWTLGGRTITVSGGSEFTCETTLLRICNTGSSVVRLKLKDAAYNELIKDAEDSGTPILPNTCVMVGVYQLGQVYTVEGGSVEVTFVMDRRVSQTTSYPDPSDSTFEQDDEKIAGPDVLVTKVDAENTLEYTGAICYNYKKGGNYVGIKIEPTINLEDYPSVVVKTYGELPGPYGPTTKSYGSEIFDEDGNLNFAFKVDESSLKTFVIEIIWHEKSSEVFYVEVDPNIVLRNN